MQWGVHCTSSQIPTMISTAVMLGAALGAFLSGYLADRFGRKPTVVGQCSPL
jgi:MFS family permease